MTTVDTSEPHSKTPQIEQDPFSPRFNSSENEGSHKDIKGHRARITKSNKTNKKPSLPLNPLRLLNTSWKLKKKKKKKNNFKG